MHAVVLTRSPFPTDPVLLSPWAVATLFGVQRVDRMYASALVRLRTSAQLHVFVAQYVRFYRPNKQGKGPSIDTAFSVFQRRRQIKQEMSQSVNVSVLDRIKLEKSKAESIKEALSARTKQVRP